MQYSTPRGKGVLPTTSLTHPLYRFKKGLDLTGRLFGTIPGLPLQDYCCVFAAIR